MPDQKVLRELVNYSNQVEELSSPHDVLDYLDRATTQSCKINVLGAVRIPMRCEDWSRIENGKTLFLHTSAPKRWWEEYSVMRQQGFDPGLMMARLSLAPYTWTEFDRIHEPLGIDRWPRELALKHGMRDGFSCPVGARWMLVYWSRKVLSEQFTQPIRALLFMAASLAAIQLQKVAPNDPERLGERWPVTPRELSVLRLLSLGMRTKDIAYHLGLGQETIRSHIKKAQEKLGANDRVHAVAEAIRQQLIP